MVRLLLVVTKDNDSTNSSLATWLFCAFCALCFEFAFTCVGKTPSRHYLVNVTLGLVGLASWDAVPGGSGPGGPGMLGCSPTGLWA